MLPAAAGLVLALGLLVLAPRHLARAAWPARAPSYALVLWQALGLVGGLLAVEIAVTVALSADGDTHGAAARALLAGSAGVPPWWALAAYVVALAVLVRLLSMLAVSTAGTLRARHRQRVLVDLVATRNPLLPGARVVDHALPLAYCLPGLRPRVVLSRGVLDLLREQEVRAVLAHESAHVEQRHDLVVLPFVALGATFPRLSAVRTAQAEVALLVEMLADDRAARAHPPAVLARALCKVGAARVPSGGLGVGGDGGDGDGVGSAGVLLRASRLVFPGPPLPLVAKAAVALAVALVLAVPVAGVLAPTL